MAKQTYTAGQVLTAAQMTTLQANDYNETVSAKTASYVLVAADAGTTITMNAAGATTITVNTALFTAGDTLKILNIGAGVCTVTAGTATVSSAGSLALNQYDSGTLYFSTTAVSIWNGAGAGDITEVTAGTGLTGGGTSGAVTLSLTTPVAVANGGTGITSFGAGIATFLGTPSSANFAAVLTDETGTGSNVFATSPTLVTPVLGTVAAGSVLTNATGLPISTGVSGLGTGVATFLATPSSANLAAAVTGETGTGAIVFGTSPTLTTPVISSIVNTGTLTLPTTTDTLVGRITTDTLQGKTLNAPVISGTSSPVTGLSSDTGSASGSLYLWANNVSKLRVLSSGPTVITGGFAPANAISAKTANFTQTLSDTFIRCTGTASITATLLAGTAGLGVTNYGTTIYITTTAAFSVVSASANIFQKTGGAATTAILPATAGAWAILVLDAVIGGWVIMCSGT